MCLNPRTIKRPDGSTMEVGCGHCSQCLKAYQDGWTARLNEELKIWHNVEQDGKMLPPVIFFTFDYNPEAVPCRYLVLTSCGYRFQDVAPTSCLVDRFWTDLSESPEIWRFRRLSMLRRWYSWAVLVNEYFDSDEYPRYRDIEPEWRRFSPTGLEYPIFDFKVPCDCGKCGVPLYALEFHTVVKKPISDVFKRARRSLEYHHPDIFAQDVNPRMNTTWRDVERNIHDLPSCCLTRSFKYFYTSEYGPTTFRPHGHGVCFGLTYDEFEETIARDWNSRYGHCEFSILRPTGGAMMYLSKYCSKGNYEHPLCCKDFVYPSGKEFHSDSYELALANFGIDAPCVNPTFHLISKGLGASYAFQAEITKYFGVQLSEMLTPSGSRRFVCSDSVERPRPSVSLDKIFALVDSNSLMDSVDVSFRDDGSILVRKYSSSGGFLVGESVISPSSVIDCAVEESLSKLKYNRAYVTHSSQTQNGFSCLPCWHKLGLCPIGTPQVKQTSIPLPRYYRQWLVSPLASALRQSASIRLHPSIDALRSFALEHPGHADKIESVISEILAAREVRNMVASEKLRKSAERQYYRPGRSPRLM